MKRQNYYPSRIAEQAPWLSNFATKLPLYATTLGLVQAKSDAAIASAKYGAYILSQWLSAVRAFSPATTDAVDLVLNGSGPAVVPLPTFTAPTLPTGVVAVPPGILTRVFDLVREIKESDNYQEAIGQDLGIIAPADTTIHNMPTVNLSLISGATCQAVQVHFVKYGHAGVYIEGRRNGGAWEFLAIDTHNPYLDERPLLVANTAETREYRVRFWDKGTPNGDWCDIVKVAVTS